jgi:TBC1 domain family protein 5
MCFTGAKISRDFIMRRFPDIEFYRESDVQEQLTNILFLYSTMHPSIGYRQGMAKVRFPYDIYSLIGCRDA